MSLPWHNDNKVHDVPGVPQIRVWVEDEAHGNDLGAHLHGEDPEEVGLQLVLENKMFSFTYLWYFEVWSLPIDGILFPDFIRQTNLDLRQNDESFNLCSGP